MTDLAEHNLKDAALSRTCQTVQAIGQLAEWATNETRLSTKRELQERCGLAKGVSNEALRILQSRGLISVRSGPGGRLFAKTPNPIARLGNSILSLDAVRIRDALDPLLIDDALDNSSAVDASDPTEFVRANWKLHAAIAQVRPRALLRSLYLSLLELIASQTISVKPVDGNRCQSMSLSVTSSTSTSSTRSLSEIVIAR